MMASPASRLEETVRAGRFALLAELTPPDSADPTRFLSKAAALRDCVLGINATDNTGARAHLSSLAASALLLQNGSEPVFIINTRDRNRLAFQAELLGAAALGIRNVVCVSGDPLPKDSGERALGDLDAVAGIRAAVHLRDAGTYLDGRPLEVAPRFFLGSTIDPHLHQLDWLEEKVAAGMQFVLTQAVFDTGHFAEFMEHVRRRGLHRRVFILAGVLALGSARIARRLRGQFPGINVPDVLVQRLEEATPEERRQIGIDRALATIGELRQMAGVAGVHIIISGPLSMVPEIAAAARSQSQER